MRYSRFLMTLLSVIGLLIPISASLTQAQDNIILSIAAPEWMQDTFNDEMFAEFEAQHPGTDVVLVLTGSNMYFGSPAYSVDGFFDSGAEYASAADVLYVENYNLVPEATRAGLFLDLAPLTSSDPSLNVDDFFPAAWQSFQWDGGVWGLPASLSLNVVVYNKTRFDELGLTYPNEAWTLDDFINAARALSKTNAQGEVTTPGMVDWGASGLLFRALLGEGVYDSTVLPNSANLQNPELEAMLNAWFEVYSEGHTGRSFSGSSQDIPLRIEGLWSLQNGVSTNGDEWGASLLPGGTAGLRVQGFALSAGTQYPEQAYELAKYLSSNVEVVTRFFGDSPARQSLVGVESEDGPQFFMRLPEEAEALREQALFAALPTSELRFMDYVNVALNRMDPEGDNLDARTALDEAEASANDALQAADEYRASQTMMVAQPTPTPVLAAGEIAVRFNYAAFVSPIPNREQWGQAIQEFVANDPQIGQIVFETGFSGTQDFEERGIDCYVLPYNGVPSLDLETVLNLDPFMNDDPTFTESDFLTGVLSQVRRENMTWAFPLFIQPEVLWYNAETFTESGVPLPENGWTVDQFIDALEMLRLDPDDPAPFVAGMSSGNAYVLLLTAAFGGLPLDYRTDPPTMNFTDPATVDAIRQVLDLAREGYIDYNPLGDMGGGGSFSNDQTIYNEPLSALSWRLRTNSNDLPSDFEDPYRLTSFPRGTQFSGIAFDVGAGYITSHSANPEACYRWLSYLSTRPDLFTAMPARRSAINTLESQMVQGADLNAVFSEIDALLQDPSTIAVPSQFGSAGASEGTWLLPIWLNRAFDAYVLEDADLEAELSEAEMMATTYMDCINRIERIALGDIMEMTTQEQTAYFRQFTDCAVAVDPSLESMFFFPEEE